MHTSVLVRFRPPEAVVHLDGELDIATRRQLVLRFEDAWDRGCRSVAVDASAVTFIDCAPLRVLSDARRRFVAAGGSFVVLRPSACFTRVARLAGYPELTSGPSPAPRPSGVDRQGRDCAAV